MINLFNIPNYNINTSNFSHYLHGSIVTEFENNFLNYIGAKYACSVNSATNAIFLSLLDKNITINIPSIIPPVVLNAILTSGNNINFIDNIDWVGNSYVLHDFGNYKIIDSAQQVDKNQFQNNANDNDLMIFSFYPTKPIGSIDGGIIVSNDKHKINQLKIMSFNGMSFSINNWDRKIVQPGYKFYMNSIQAYIANENLKKLNEKKNRLRYIRNIYNKAFNLNNNSYHLYRIRVQNRNNLIEKLKENNIACGIHYDMQHKNPIYANKLYQLYESEQESKTTLSIPFHEKLNDKDIIKIIKVINENKSS